MHSSTRTSNPMHTKSWSALTDHAQDLKTQRIESYFDHDPARFDTMHIDVGAMFFDYSKHHITSKTLELFTQLCEEMNLDTQKQALFDGAAINLTENRAALHTALRDPNSPYPEVQSGLAKVKDITEKLISNGDITDIINVGIGGSDLGARAMSQALQTSHSGKTIHFLSNIDGMRVQSLTQNLDPAKTAIIICSKTFTTQETMSNAALLKDWSGSALNFYAVTNDQSRAIDFGIAQENILNMPEWVGGRFSLWSPIGLCLALQIGFDGFQQLLSGAHAMDQHFRTAPVAQNMPTIMALLSILYTNFFDYRAQAILPYASALSSFVSYIQQMEMESNGKHIDRDGKPVSYCTSPIIWGGVGTNAQHAFFQLLHQGTHIVPADFIMIKNPPHPYHEQQEKLISNAIGQTMALMRGQENAQEPHRSFDGNRPSSTIILNDCTPYSLGMLFASYEHKIFVQGALLNINSFDQWGVELGKSSAKEILNAFHGLNSDALDPSSAGLFAYLRQQKEAP